MNDRHRALRRIKLVHTCIWGFFAACILGLPLAASMGQFRVAFLLMGIVALEVLVLLANGLRCPLTSVAANYTEEREDNFDIYLPLWIARHNKAIFGSLYLAGVLYTLVLWRNA